jgi:AraC-like DNA-binding protein
MIVMRILCRMNAIIHTPQNELREAIDYIWYHEAAQVKISSYSIPFLHQELIINFGAHLSVTGTHKQRFDYDLAGGISGLSSCPVITRVKGHYKAIGILLKPFGLYRLFGFHAAKLDHCPLRLHDIWGLHSLALVAQLESTPDPLEKIRVLEKILLQVARPAVVPKEILALNEDISLQKGHIKSQLHNTRISSKKYIQTCHEVIGVTPKKYTQLRLVNAALTQIASHPSTSLTSVAYDNGFYDQAHFIRVFKSFAGITPSAYKAAVIKGQVHMEFPNTIFI